MSFFDLMKVASLVVGSLGGGGLIVFGLSNFLGRLWADRALEKTRHDHAVIIQKAQNQYDALRQQMQKQLDISAKRLQLELDSLALVHKLRIQEEFSFLSTLWKKMSALSSEFQKAMAREARFIQTEPRVLFHPEFKEALKDAQQFVFEQSIFFPAPIVKVADALLLHPEMAGLHLIREPRDLLGAETLYHAPFEEDKAKLHWLIRKHLKGEELPDD